MKLIRRLVIFLMILVFIFGLGVLLYPYVKGHLVDNRIQHDAEEFLSWVEIAPFVPDSSGSHVVDQDHYEDHQAPNQLHTYPSF